MPSGYYKPLTHSFIPTRQLYPPTLNRITHPFLEEHLTTQPFGFFYISFVFRSVHGLVVTKKEFAYLGAQHHKKSLCKGAGFYNLFRYLFSRRVTGNKAYFGRVHNLGFRARDTVYYAAIHSGAGSGYSFPAGFLHMYGFWSEATWTFGVLARQGAQIVGPGFFSLLAVKGTIGIRRWSTAHKSAAGAMHPSFWIGFGTLMINVMRGYFLYDGSCTESGESVKQSRTKVPALLGFAPRVQSGQL